VAAERSAADQYPDSDDLFCDPCVDGCRHVFQR